MASSDEPSDPEYEKRLRRRLVTLKEELAAGRIHFASGLQVIESLKAVRYGADGEIDLSTVDGLVRSTALSVEFFKDRRETKGAISLLETQKLYFEILDRNFGEIYTEMRKVGVTPHDVARHISREGTYRDDIAKGVPDFLAQIEEFWEIAGPAVHIHLEEMHGPLKCIFGGDLFPSHDENIASKCGIYTDTIILPDPFLRSRELFANASAEQKVYYIVKHALNALQYKDLACAELDQPIVVICPDYTALQSSEKEFVAKISEGDALFHAKEVFGREFSSVEELLEFSERLDTVEAVLAEIKKPERVLFDTNWGASIRDNIIRAQADDRTRMLGDLSPGMLITSQAFGRMGTSNELLIKARRLGGSPIIDAPTSWQYFNWKLEYDAVRAARGIVDTDLHVLRGIESLSGGEMQWLGNVPPEAIIEIRKVGALPEIRKMLSSGVADLVQTNPTNFYRTTDKIFDNIHAAFAEHQKKIDELKAKKWKFATKDIGTWLAVGTIEVAAALTGTPAWGLSAVAANQLTDATKLKDIPASIKKLVDENEKLKQSPVGLLFKFKT